LPLCRLDLNFLHCGMKCHIVRNIPWYCEQIFYKLYDVHATHMLWVKLNQISL
jgi:hypothetical protein